MFVIDDSLKIDPRLDNATRHILDVTRFRGLRHEDGRELFGHPFKDGTWMIVEPVKSIEAGAKESAWIAGHVDQSGRGFRLSEPLDLHNAIVGTFTMPSPLYSRGEDVQVIDEQVADTQEAKLILAGRLTAAPEIENEEAYQGMTLQ